MATSVAHPSCSLFTSHPGTCILCIFINTCKPLVICLCAFLVSFPAPQPSNHSPERPFSRGEDEFIALSSEGQRSPEVTIQACTPSPPLPPSPPPQAPDKEKAQTPKLFSPSKISFNVRTFLSTFYQLMLPSYLATVFVCHVEKLEWKWHKIYHRQYKKMDDASLLPVVGVKVLSLYIGSLQIRVSLSSKSWLWTWTLIRNI